MLVGGWIAGHSNKSSRNRRNIPKWCKIKAWHRLLVTQRYSIWYRASCTTTAFTLDKSEKYQTEHGANCGIFMNSEKKIKGSPSFHFRSIRDSVPACFSGLSLPTWHITRALRHLCQLHDCHDPGRQEYYMATWKEANTWTKLSTRLSHNTDLFSASIYKPPSSLSLSLSYGAHKWLGIV